MDKELKAESLQRKAKSYQLPERHVDRSGDISILRERFLRYGRNDDFTNNQPQQPAPNNEPPIALTSQ